MTNRPARLRETAFDGLTAALSPVLIIGMIGSLVFFLVIAFYRGQYDARLMYILGLYTVAIVLLARIAIESDRTRAAMFAAPLAIVAILGMMRFVTLIGDWAAIGWLINVGLLALAWYLADRITFDCTLLEEDRESLQGGLLQTIGSSVAQAAGQETKPALVDARGKVARQPIGAAPLKKARHNPGVWVLYFALIAFPLFGVGQLMIPDERQRALAFWFLVAYLGFALALLMTTSLLGMRRYLRQRGAMMPPEITARWLIAGGLITVAILIACMLMPLPGKQLSVAGLKLELTSPDNLTTSRWGWGQDGSAKGQAGQVNPQTKGDGQTDNQAQQPQANQANQPANPPTDQSDNHDPSNGQPQGSPDQASDTQTKGENQQGNSQNSQSKTGSSQASSGSPASPSQDGPKPSSSSQQQQSNSQQSKQSQPSNQSNAKQSNAKQPPSDQSNQSQSQSQSQSADQSRPSNQPSPDRNDRQPPGNPPQQAQPKRGQPEPEGKPTDEPANQQTVDQKNNQNDDQNRAQTDAQPGNPPTNAPLRAGDSLSQTSRSIASSLLDMFKTLGSFLKWILIAVFAGIVLFYVATHFEEFKRTIADLMNFINALMGRKTSPTSAPVKTEDKSATEPARRPFSSYVNPFAKGLSDWQGPQIVEHTFAALEAWAAVRGRVRPANQTAEEFARALALQEPELDRLPLQAASMLDRVMFAGWQPTREEVSLLSKLWDRMS